MNTTEEAPAKVITKNVANKSEKKRAFVLPWLFGILAVIGLGFAIFTGIRSRETEESKLASDNQQNNVTFVSVTQPKADTATDEVTLPGNALAFTDTPIYARTSGYLKKWYFDIGAHVKQGDLLAELDTPELDQQTDEAQADLKNAQANAKLSEVTSGRYQDLLKSNSVSQQEVDQTASDLNSKKALVDSSEANLRRLEALQAFKKVYAPFDGVITARETDTGDLVQGGDPNSSKELFHLSATQTLRVFVAVPEVYTNRIHEGETVTLTSDSTPGQTFKGTLARTSGSIDLASRTLNTEVDVENAASQLLPGAYVFVHIPVGTGSKFVTIPSNTLLFRSEGLRVGVVKDGKVALVPITIGHDYGTSVEVVSGLTSQDSVILDPSDSLSEGEKVRVAPMSFVMAVSFSKP